MHKTKSHSPPKKEGKSNNTKLQSDQELTLSISALENICDSRFTFINLFYYNRLSYKTIFFFKQRSCNNTKRTEKKKMNEHPTSFKYNKKRH